MQMEVKALTRYYASRGVTAAHGDNHRSIEVVQSGLRT
jgi:hypothetical protein